MSEVWAECQNLGHTLFSKVDNMFPHSVREIKIKTRTSENRVIMADKIYWWTDHLIWISTFNKRKLDTTRPDKHGRGFLVPCMKIRKRDKCKYRIMGRSVREELKLREHVKNYRNFPQKGGGYLFFSFM